MFMSIMDASEMSIISVNFQRTNSILFSIHIYVESYCKKAFRQMKGVMAILYKTGGSTLW